MIASSKNLACGMLLAGAVIVGCRKNDEPVVPVPAPVAPAPPAPVPPTPKAADANSSTGLTFDEIVADAKAIQLSSRLKDQIHSRDWTSAQATFDELNGLRPRLSSAKQSSIDLLQKLLSTAKGNSPAPAQ